MIAAKWIFLLFLIHLASSSKILVLIPWYDRSHYVVFESLIEELLERGHEVREWTISLTQIKIL